jgi:hypothetical protein
LKSEFCGSGCIADFTVSNVSNPRQPALKSQLNVCSNSINMNNLATAIRMEYSEDELVLRNLYDRAKKVFFG